MYTTGLVLTIVGAIVVLIAALSLSCTQTKEETSAAEEFDFYILGGFITFFRDLYLAIGEGSSDRSSTAFRPLMIFYIGLVLLGIGGSLMHFSVGGK